MIRGYFNLKETWAFEYRDYASALKALRDCVERKHISVVINGIVGDNTHRALEVEEFRGFVLFDQLAPMIFINGRDAKAAQIFTLVHELAHLAFASTGVVSPNAENEATGQSERLCDAIAAEVLAPTSSFLSHWLESDGEYRDAERLAKLYKVSFVTCARRIRDLGFLTEKDFFSMV